MHISLHKYVNIWGFFLEMLYHMTEFFFIKLFLFCDALWDAVVPPCIGGEWLNKASSGSSVVPHLGCE